MFKIYDLNMNEIPFPDGVKPLDIFVSSIGKKRETEEIPGRNGVADYGTNYTHRNVNLTLWAEAQNAMDYRLRRNALYRFLDEHDVFYIAETHLPSRVLKIAVDESYIPDRLTRLHAQIDVTCRTIDSLFWESIYTTLELNDSGYSAAISKYGLADNIDMYKTQYRFTENDFTVYNAGNVPVEPESMYLQITIGMMFTDDGFKLTNKTTGETFEWKKPVSGRNIYIRGMNISEGTAVPFALRDTNRRFISLVPGDNLFEVSGGTFSQISVDTKYYFK